MHEILRLIGYGLFAAGLLIFLWVVVDCFAERFIDAPEDWWDDWT